jgi:tricorn protease
MSRLYSVLVLLFLAAGFLHAEEARLLRFPDVHIDRVVFVYVGNLYVAPRTGGQAIRLTSHEGLELFPKFSPDGDCIAFSGQYDGDMAVYVMPVTGGEPKRLTYHPGIQRTSERFGPENLVMGWHPEGDKVLYRSRKEVNDWWDGRAYAADTNGGMPVPLPMAVAGFTSFSPDGDKVVYCPIFRDFRTWKRYKGGMAQDVWTFDLNTYDARKITDWEGTDNMPMWYRDRIYFNSDRTGTLNLYCYEPTAERTRPVTEFTEYDVRWPSLGPDAIAFENGGYVYVLDLPSETLNKVEIHLTSDRHTVRPEYEKVSDKIDGFDISPNAKRAVFRARGDIFTVPAEEGNTRNLTESPGANEMYPRWSPDGEWIAYLSDATGEEEFYIRTHDGEETIRLTTGGDCHRYAPEWSPDSKKLVFSDKKLRLFSIDVETREVTQIDKAERSRIGEISWSPDSRCVAYSKRLANRIMAIFVYSFEDGKVHQVTPGFTNDYSPVFDPEGKYLYFMSERDFNPILSSYEFSFVNNSIENLFLIVLDRDERSPFAPESDEALDEWDEDEWDDDKWREREREEDSEEPVSVKIDFDGIFDRQVAFDLPAGNYSGLSAVEEAVFYISGPVRGLRGKVTQDESVLYKYDIDEKKNHEFLSGIGDYRLAAKGKRMLLSKGADYYVVKTRGKKADLDDAVKMDLSGMEMLVDRKAEYVQMFHQVWRRQRDFFYDENMHGVDWQKMRARYSPLLPHVADRYDLTYLLGEMVGELCCSHTYVGGGDRPKIDPCEIGLLGVDFEIDQDNNRIRIARILKGENWDEGLRSPLREPGVDVNEGDYLLAVNDKPITAEMNPYSLTENTVGKQVVLTVNSRPTMTGAHEVTVKPVASEERLRYYNWVESKREYVDSVSDGRIGYIHIPDMGSYGLVRFTKMFYNQLRKPGLIIDVRYNGGGFVSGLILERLRREVMAMGSSRNYAEGPMPGHALNAHMVTLLNEFSCSDGDYFPYFFRELKLGPLMGKRSWGGVIGISGMDRLVDGGYYTVPQWSIYGLDGNWIMENVGVYPDIEVDNPPDRRARGYDDQLDRALEYIQDKLAEDPKTLPPKPGPPSPR